MLKFHKFERNDKQNIKNRSRLKFNIPLNSRYRNIYDGRPKDRPFLRNYIPDGLMGLFSDLLHPDNLEKKGQLVLDI